MHFTINFILGSLYTIIKYNLYDESRLKLIEIRLLRYRVTTSIRNLMSSVLLSMIILLLQLIEKSLLNHILNQNVEVMWYHHTGGEKPKELFLLHKIISSNYSDSNKSYTYDVRLSLYHHCWNQREWHKPLHTTYQCTLLFLIKIVNRQTAKSKGILLNIVLTHIKILLSKRVVSFKLNN